MRVVFGQKKSVGVEKLVVFALGMLKEKQF